MATDVFQHMNLSKIQSHQAAGLILAGNPGKKGLVIVEGAESSEVLRRYRVALFLSEGVGGGWQGCGGSFGFPVSGNMTGFGREKL